MRIERKRPYVNSADFFRGRSNQAARKARECRSTLPVGLQFSQHVIDEFRNLALVERVAMYRLLPDRAIRQPLRRLLHEVKDHRAFAEANILVADFRRSPAPRLPAPIRATNESRVSAG